MNTFLVILIGIALFCGVYFVAVNVMKFIDKKHAEKRDDSEAQKKEQHGKR